jgi:Flp pilus assembly protein TadB
MTVLAAFVGAAFAVGIWLIVSGFHSSTTAVHLDVYRRLPSDAGNRLLRAVIVGGGLVVVTRWPVAALAGGAAGWWSPEVVGGRSGRERAVARTEAIATWTEMLRDTMAGAHGLEEAITTTAAVAPDAIRSEVVRLAARTEQEPLRDALVSFATDLSHPTGDLVVAALGLAAGGAVRDLGELLSSLAGAARDEAAMRLRVEAARARLRTAVQVIAATSAAMVAGLVLLNPTYVKVYASPVGQSVLALIAVGWGMALWWLARMSRFDAPERFLAPIAGDAR